MRLASREKRLPLCGVGRQVVRHTLAVISPICPEHIAVKLWPGYCYRRPFNGRGEQRAQLCPLIQDIVAYHQLHDL